MVHASNPRLMNRVLDVVERLCDGKGSTAQDILDFLRQTSKSTPRNLTMQVHRALKHAVNAGLLRHRSGHYKSLFMLKPVPVKQTSNENNREKLTNEAKDKQKASSKTKKDKGDSRNKKQRRERGRKRSRSGERRRKRRSGSKKQDVVKNKIGKPKYKEKGGSGRSPRHKISNSRLQADIGNASSSSNRKRSKPRPRDSSSHSDLSDCNDYESRKAKVRRRDPSLQERKQDGNGRENRSVSRNRSVHRQQSQQSHAKHCNDDDKANQVSTKDGKNDEVDQNTGRDHESNNSGSNSSL
ncbi:PREDICTED: micronuclear linker histone polyprotein-like [Eufriesea mexicana]|uniref:micronuclear linker histone polyprotein-like n=1 Tax=Eufriesea mexicana TaxID=516756 RepID=UPI00083BE9D4|nr:PREDICTED: micronuclear linker histone polyprotein-like [Eufriesea mexicana]